MASILEFPSVQSFRSAYHELLSTTETAYPLDRCARIIAKMPPAAFGKVAKTILQSLKAPDPSDVTQRKLAVWTAFVSRVHFSNKPDKKTIVALDKRMKKAVSAMEKTNPDILGEFKDATASRITTKRILNFAIAVEGLLSGTNINDRDCMRLAIKKLRGNDFPDAIEEVVPLLESAAYQELEIDDRDQDNKIEFTLNPVADSTQGEIIYVPPSEAQRERWVRVMENDLLLCWDLLLTRIGKAHSSRESAWVATSIYRSILSLRYVDENGEAVSKPDYYNTRFMARLAEITKKHRVLSNRQNLGAKAEPR